MTGIGFAALRATTPWGASPHPPRGIVAKMKGARDLVSGPAGGL